MLTCTRLISRFFSNAHHRGSLPQQLAVVWDQLLKTDPEGPTLISHAAYPHDWSVHDELLSVCACSTLKPRKSKASGLPRPRRLRFAAAWRPNSIRRVLSGCRLTQRRNAQRALPSIRFSDVPTPRRQRPVAPPVDAPVQVAELLLNPL